MTLLDPRRIALTSLVVAAGCGGACTCGGGASGGGSLVVADRFTQAGATGSNSEAVERLHPYVAGGVAVLDVRSQDWLVDATKLTASSSDGSVFTVRAQEEEQSEPGDLFGSADALQVTLHAVAEGSADLVFTDAGGGVVDTRPIRVVVPDALVLEYPVTVPGMPDPPLDLSALRVGPLGADLLVAFGAGGERAYGLEALSLRDAAGGFVTLEQTPLGVEHGIAPEREVLRFHPGIGAHGVPLEYDGAPFATVQVVPAVDEDVAAADFMRHQTLAEFLEANTDVDIPDEIVDALRNSGDPEIVCGKEDQCAARLNPVDADGNAVLGVSVTWDLAADADGDILLFKKAFLASSTVTATVNGMERSITIPANKEDASAVRSTSAHCAQAGDTVGVVGVAGLALFAVRRRRRISARPSR